MCFYNDYDWVAEINEETAGVSPAPAKCHECGQRIAANEWRRHVHQQEHVHCERCEDLDEGDTCDRHEYGETYDYDRCETCEKILVAIGRFESANGCAVHESQPALGMLRDELLQHHDGRLYVAVAIESYPELGAVDWLVELVAGLEEE